MNRIGLVTIATGAYQTFLPRLVKTASDHLDDLVKIFILSDRRPEVTSGVDLEWLPWGPLDWPLITLTRHRAVRSYGERFSELDVIVHIDVDMAFVQRTTFEASPLFAVRHPGYRDSPREKLPFETNPESSSFIPKERSANYLAGGVQGGQTSTYLRACEVVSEMVQQDLNNGIIPIWHDESAWNRFCLEADGLRELDATYCTPERLRSESTKIVALDKNHRRLRRRLRR